MKDLTAADLNHAFLNQLPIEIRQDGHLIGMGLIRKHTMTEVILDDGMHYLKRNCEFKVK